MGEMGSKAFACFANCQRGYLKACVGAFKLLEKSSRRLFKAWRTVDKPDDLLTWRTDKTFLCSIGSDAFFCNPKRRSWVFVMAAKLSATLSPPTRRNAALLSLQHPCRFKSRSKFSELCSEECRDVGCDSLLTNLEHRKHEWQLAAPCNVVSFEEMCGVECLQPKTPGLLRVLRD